MEAYNAVVYFAQRCVINILTSGILDKALLSVMAMFSSASSHCFVTNFYHIMGYFYICVIARAVSQMRAKWQHYTDLSSGCSWTLFFLFIYGVGAEDYSGQQKINRQTDPQRASLTSHMTFFCRDRRTEWKRPASRPMYRELAGVQTNIWDSASSTKDPS